MPDRLARLEAHVVDLEMQMGDASGSAYAALSRQYMEALRQMDEISSKAPAATSPLDEIAQRRSRRKPVKNGESREA